jgi:hypothetical protein
MTELPHDFADLYLAPVALKVDARIMQLAALDDDKLALHIAIESDEPDWTTELRRDALLRTVGNLIDLHGWELSWDARGVRLAHDEHSVVLGVPANVVRYVEAHAN